MYEKNPNNFNDLENVSECFNYTMMKLQLGYKIRPIDEKKNHILQSSVIITVFFIKVS